MHEVERRALAGCRRTAGSRADSRPCSSRCAGSSRPAGSRTHSPGTSPSPSHSPSSSPTVASSCMPRQMPRNGTPASGALEHDLGHAAVAQVRGGVPERADARQHDPVGGGDRRGIVVTTTSGDTRVLEALLGAAQVAHAVVDDRDHSAPFVDGTPAPAGRCATASRSARRTPWPRPRRRGARSRPDLEGCSVSPALFANARRTPRRAWCRRCR